MSDEREAAPPPTTAKEVGRVVGTNLLLLLFLQGSVILILTQTGGDRVGAALVSLNAVAAHGLYLLVRMLIAFVAGRVGLGLAYLLTLGMVLSIGVGACFAVAA